MSCSLFIHISSKHMNYEELQMTGRDRRRGGWRRVEEGRVEEGRVEEGGGGCLQRAGRTFRHLFFLGFFTICLFSLRDVFLFSLSDTGSICGQDTHTHTHTHAHTPTHTATHTPTHTQEVAGEHTEAYCFVCDSDH